MHPLPVEIANFMDRFEPPDFPEGAAILMFDEAKSVWVPAEDGSGLERLEITKGKQHLTALRENGEVTKVTTTDDAFWTLWLVTARLAVPVRTA